MKKQINIDIHLHVKSSPRAGAGSRFYQSNTSEGPNEEIIDKPKKNEVVYKPTTELSTSVDKIMQKNSTPGGRLVDDKKPRFDDSFLN